MKNGEVIVSLASLYRPLDKTVHFKHIDNSRVLFLIKWKFIANFQIQDMFLNIKVFFAVLTFCFIIHGNPTIDESYPYSGKYLIESVSIFEILRLFNVLRVMEFYSFSMDR